MLHTVPLLLLLADGASAEDLRVSFTAPGAKEPVEMVYPDVKPGRLPGFVAPAPDGAEYIVYLTVSLLSVEEGREQQVQFDAEIKAVQPKGGRGRAVVQTVSNPRVVTLPGVRAKIQQGARHPVPNTDPVRYVEWAMTLEMLYGEERPGEVVQAADLEPSMGKVVRVTGMAGRAKLADQVRAEGFAVYCLGSPLPDDLLGKTVTVEGRLERTGEFAAVVAPDGAISQGTEPGTEVLVLRECRVVPSGTP